MRSKSPSLKDVFTPNTLKQQGWAIFLASPTGDLLDQNEEGLELARELGIPDDRRGCGGQPPRALRKAFLWALRGRISRLHLPLGDRSVMAFVTPVPSGVAVMASLGRSSLWEELLLEHLDRIGAVLDHEGRVMAATRAMREHLKAPMNRLLGKRFSRFLQSPATASSVAWIVKNKGQWEGEVNLRRMDGAALPLKVLVRSINDPRFGRVGFLVLAETPPHETPPTWICTHDPVTALPNRSYLLSRLSEMIPSAEKPVGLLLADMDRFRDVNVLLGHDGGDRMLHLALRRIKDAVGKNEGVFRLEGNTFAVILPHDEIETLSLGNRVVEAFKAPLSETHPVINVSCSVGISVSPCDGTRPDELLDKAFHALRRAKELGGGRCVRYDRDIRRDFTMRMVLENGIRRAIREGHFQLHYQPLVNPLNCKVVAMEALLRWPTGKGTYVPPSKFIPIAESTGLILEIGEWVLNQACMDAKKWSQGPIGEVPVSVNLSGTELRLGNPEEKIRLALERSNLDPRLLIVEISENAILEERRRAEKVFLDLRRTGVKVYIDDFGTGYSSLSYLRDFTLDGLKVDKSFVNQVPRNERDMALISAILGMAKALKLETVVEGVETKEQCSAVTDMGIGCIQGFLFSPPRPLAVLEALVSDAGVLLPSRKSPG
ncbi:diguanylate cyclase (GGDEF) domain-containing protein [Thermanaerovibrio velox DSM 12556]|uniref:Diguanylate cyclase (GGDEF) domain-containing protein n=1 Tax=Thermanaerovibrio velox DSM 12556 TaxID=926567 RepID=H0UPU2_9BACT|nr:bifunctional diguanylate cyclase/phosphodiesterase [Thermanaerovibrio velox]EHM10651.1 diguanylate cyclase (GGDEF) domain-containing protein [Thermanaerovibrio velox DSM 12556]